MFGNKRNTPTADDHYMQGLAYLRMARESIEVDDDDRAQSMAALAAAEFGAGAYVIAFEHARLPTTPQIKGTLRDARA